MAFSMTTAYFMWDCLFLVSSRAELHRTGTAATLRHSQRDDHAVQAAASGPGLG